MKTLAFLAVGILITVLATGQVPQDKQEELSSAEQIKAIGYDPAKVYEFLAQLQEAVAANKKKVVSSLVDYPLNVVSRGRTHKISKSSFLKQYDEIFTPTVKAALAAQRPEHLYVKSTGFMIGRGELWFNEAGDGKFRIVTVQPATSFHKKAL
jgi:hypothetical protein